MRKDAAKLARAKELLTANEEVKAVNKSDKQLISEFEKEEKAET